jgi:hypothetical protein
MRRWLVGLGLVAACGGSAPQIVAEGLPGGLLSVRAVAPDDVWVIGASSEPADGTGPWVLRYDGEAWSRLDLAAWDGAELWWGHVTASEVVLVGDGGLILEGPRDGALSEVEGPSEQTNFFGVWGASEAEVWAVGSRADDPDRPVLWRRSAGVWAEVDLRGIDGVGSSLFKVHGTAADDVWFVGSEGTILHWDGAALEVVPSGHPTAPLLTVDAGGERPYAVGGIGNGLVLEYDGGAWVDASPSFQPGFNGVCAGGDAAWAVGQLGARAQRIDGVWRSDVDEDVAPLIPLDWHGCAVDGDGGLWMVGGRISSRPLREGVIGYQGEAPPAALDVSAL